MAVDPNCSTCLFVYPFLFAPEEFDRRAAAVEGASRTAATQEPRAHAGATLPVWRAAGCPIGPGGGDATGFQDELLPQVARYLHAPPGAPAGARLWIMDEAALQSPQGLGAQAEWVLHFPQGELPFRIEEVRLALFHVGVGLLALRASPGTDEPAAWLDLIHYFRYAAGQRGVRLQARRRTGVDPETRAPRWSPYFPPAAGGTEAHPDGSGTLRDLLDGLLRTGAAPAGDPWWREVFIPGQLLPFAIVYADDLPASEQRPFLYRLRRFFPSRREIHPGEADLAPGEDACLSYAADQWFFFSLDGGGFVAFDAPRTDFFRNQLPAHLREQYFLLFLLALHQRFALMMLEEEVALHWSPSGEEADLGPRLRAFERIRDLLLAFVARGYFPQVMQRENHHRCYLRWQETFQLERLYRDVHDEVSEMHAHLTLRQNERLEERTGRLEERISLLGILIGVPALVISFLGVNIRHLTSGEGMEPLWAAGIGFGGGILIGVAIILALRARGGR